ncbi:uncharacterized protein LOC143290777 [Babylonia areolata]|uniref:uncharacterized protein LOC143290777 n=1 Tax=Babylonia areolata TaxID=304850 RepID=UPI003FD24F9B
MFETDAKSALWGISPILLVVGSLYHVTSIAAPHWLANSTAHWGLWNYCPVEGGCVSITEELNGIDHSWYRAVQGLEIAATVFVLTALVTGLMRINMGQRIWQTACGLSAVVAGVFGLSGVAVFGWNYQSIPEQVLSWAYMFNAASSAMCLMAGPVLILDVTLHRT